MTMTQANKDIRQQMEQKGIKQYQLAYLMGVSKYTLNSWLQIPLNDERRARILKTLDEIEN